MDDSNCILHRGAITDGYGVKKYKGKLVRAHRLAYCQANDVELDAISGMVVMHECDNRACVNPRHLSLGTHNDNCQDKVRKGRQAKGETSGKSKLKTSDIHDIRRLLDAGLSLQKIAGKYGVSTMCISKISTGKTWGHVWAE